MTNTAAETAAYIAFNKMTPSVPGGRKAQSAFKAGARAVQVGANFRADYLGHARAYDAGRRAWSRVAKQHGIPAANCAIPAGE
jgi:hypothetical protein